MALIVLKAVKEEIAKDLREKMKLLPALPKAIAIKAGQGFKKLGRDWVLSQEGRDTLGVRTGGIKEKSFRASYRRGRNFQQVSMSSPWANIWQNKKEGRKIKFLAKMGRKYKREGIVQQIVEGLLNRIKEGKSIEK